MMLQLVEALILFVVAVGVLRCRGQGFVVWQVLQVGNATRGGNP